MEQVQLSMCSIDGSAPHRIARLEALDWGCIGYGQVDERLLGRRPTPLVVISCDRAAHASASAVGAASAARFQRVVSRSHPPSCLLLPITFAPTSGAASTSKMSM